MAGVSLNIFNASLKVAPVACTFPAGMLFSVMTLEFVSMAVTLSETDRPGLKSMAFEAPRTASALTILMS